MVNLTCTSFCFLLTAAQPSSHRWRLIRPRWVSVTTSRIQPFINWELLDRFLIRLINNVRHASTRVEISLNVLWVCGPSCRIPSEGWTFARVDTDKMPDESHVIVHELWVIKKANLSRSPKVKSHPDTSIIELEVFAPFFWLAFGRMPSCEVSTGPVMRHPNDFTTTKIQSFSWSRPTMFRPGRTIT